MNTLSVIKIGGNVVEDEDVLEKFLDEFASVPHQKILVHGGGKRASAIGRKLGIEPKMIDGRRITDSKTLEVVTMVYGGLNRNLVARLQARGINALGLTGADMNLIPAHKRANSSVDYGYVGDFEVNDIKNEQINWLLNANITPVFCALTHDQKGHLLNTNADTMATGLAISMSKRWEVSLNYCFEKQGVLLDLARENDYIPALTYTHYQELKKQKIIADGMIPKLDNAFNALNSGVQHIRVRHALGIAKPQGTELIM